MSGTDRVRRGCLGCFVLILAMILVVFIGVGRPETCWNRIKAVQIFEGPESVILFVEVDQVTERPGLVRSPGTVYDQLRLFRFEVTADGKVKQRLLEFEQGESFELWNRGPVTRLSDGFYLFKRSLRLSKIGEDRIERLSEKDSAAIVRGLPAQIQSFNFNSDVFDRVSKANGWTRLIVYDQRFKLSAELAVSAVHKMSLKIVLTDPSRDKNPSQEIRAESLDRSSPWSVRLLRQDNRRWWVYSGR
ncbi:hypothetical protein EP7_004942 [Isosphaeraceae bacterium EP7]